MNVMKRKLSILLLALLVFVVSIVPVLASHDNISYSFNLGLNYENSYSEGRYRQTTNTSNKWKVNMTHNSEGMGAKATYWLARTGDKAIVSDVHTITCGSGNHLYNAYAGASKATVSLGVENNNNATCTVAGYWDEETN